MSTYQSLTVAGFVKNPKKISDKFYTFSVMVVEGKKGSETFEWFNFGVTVEKRIKFFSEYGEGIKKIIASGQQQTSKKDNKTYTTWMMRDYKILEWNGDKKEEKQETPTFTADEIPF